MNNPAKFLIDYTYESFKELRKNYLSMSALKDFRKKRLSVSGFQHWRKSYWKTRCIVYCLIGAASAYNLSGVKPDSISNLVRYACIGIESAKIQPYKSAELYRQREARKMQEGIKEVLRDLGYNGKIGDKEIHALDPTNTLSVADLEKPSKANLEALVETSKKLGLSAKGLTAGQIRRDALVFALKEERKEHDEMWSEIEPNFHLKYAKPKDYLKPITWERGAWHFFSMMQGVVYFPIDKIAESTQNSEDEQFYQQNVRRIFNFYPAMDESGKYKNRWEEHKAKIVESMHAKE